MEDAFFVKIDMGPQSSRGGICLGRRSFTKYALFGGACGFVENREVVFFNYEKKLEKTKWGAHRKT